MRAPHYPLAPVLRGEGRGEGSVSKGQESDSQKTPHPNPLPRLRGRGSQTNEPKVKLGGLRRVSECPEMSHFGRTSQLASGQNEPTASPASVSTHRPGHGLQCESCPILSR